MKIDGDNTVPLHPVPANNFLESKTKKMENKVKANLILSYEVIYIIAIFAIVGVQASLPTNYFLVGYLIFILIGFPISFLILKERLNGYHLIGFAKLKRKKPSKSSTIQYLICNSFWILGIHVIIFVSFLARTLIVLNSTEFSGENWNFQIAYPPLNDPFMTPVLFGVVLVYILGIYFVEFMFSYRSYLKKLDIDKNIKNTILPLIFST